MTDWRGQTLPVVDLRAHLKLPDSPPDVKNRLLVLDRPGLFAVLVERPGRILATRATHSVETPGEEPDDSIRLVRTDGGLVRILDPTRLFGETEGNAGDRSPAATGPSA